MTARSKPAAKACRYVNVVDAMLTDEEDPSVRFTTGISELDQLVGPRIAPGKVMIASGAPGCTKSGNAIQAARANALAGHPVIYATFDKDPHDPVLRVAVLDGVVAPHDYSRKARHGAALHVREHYPTLTVAAGKLEDTIEALPPRGGILIVDSLHTADLRRAIDDERQRLKAVCDLLRHEARMNRRWVLALSEVAISRRSGDYAVKGDGGIAHLADVLTTLRARGTEGNLRVTATCVRPKLGKLILRSHKDGSITGAEDERADDDLKGIFESAPSQRKPSTKGAKPPAVKAAKAPATKRKTVAELRSQVAEFLTRHPNATPEQVAEAVKGRRQRVLRFARELQGGSQ